MTSMLLTLRYAVAAAGAAAGMFASTKAGRRGHHRGALAARSGSGILGAVAGCDALLLGVLGRRLFDHLAQHCLVGRDPVADDLPLVAIPGLELHQPRALVIRARHLERRHQA